MSSAIKVLIIDDNSLFRSSVKQMIAADPDFQVLGEAETGLQGLEMTKALKPDLILLDLKVNGMSGLEMLAHIKSFKLKARCVILAASGAENELLEALRTGASGYLLKEMISDELCANLEKAMSGVTILQENLKKTLINAIIGQNLSANEREVFLSDREQEILDCLTQQLNNKSIARDLGISVSTVKVHIKHLFLKLNLTSRQEVAAWAHKQCMLISPQAAGMSQA